MDPADAEAIGRGLPAGLSGDPLLKRLVMLSQLGWRARLVMLSNGTLVVGTLISPSDYRSALAEAVRLGPSEERRFEVLDQMVAAAILSDDPDPNPLGAPADIPEPRYIHLADVLVGKTGRVPFLRLRLPAVSGFWLTSISEPIASEPVSEGR